MTTVSPRPPKPRYVRSGTPDAEIPRDGDRPVYVIASSKRRFLARLVDLAVLFLTAVALLATPMTIMVMESDTSSTLMAWILMPAMALTIVASILLRLGGLVWWGCTVGQRVAGIRVVQAENGMRPTWKRAFNRWLPVNHGMSIFPGVGDIFIQMRDKKLGQCTHDREARTVVVMAQAPPPAEVLEPTDSGLAVLSKPEPGDAPVDDAHARRWEKRERVLRIVLGSTIGILLVTVLTAPTLITVLHSGAGGDSPTGPGEPKFAINTFYDDELRFENRFGERRATFERTSGTVLDNASGCIAGVTKEAARTVLRQTRCEGRIEVAFKTTDGVLVSGHVLKFPDATAAVTAKQSLDYSDFRFTPGKPKNTKGGHHIGDVGSEGRYVVVTHALSPKQPGSSEKAKNAFVLMHAPTLNVIVWF